MKPGTLESLVPRKDFYPSVEISLSYMDTHDGFLYSYMYQNCIIILKVDHLIKILRSLSNFEFEIIVEKMQIWWETWSTFFNLLTLYLLVSSAIRLDPDQARQNVVPYLDPNCFGLQIVFLKEFFEKRNFIKSQQMTTKM